jgi:hypothetical protein
VANAALSFFPNFHVSGECGSLEAPLGEEVSLWKKNPMAPGAIIYVAAVLATRPASGTFLLWQSF